MKHIETKPAVVIERSFVVELTENEAKYLRDILGGASTTARMNHYEDSDKLSDIITFSVLASKDPILAGLNNLLGHVND